jgi:hypothetical protein
MNREKEELEEFEEQFGGIEDIPTKGKERTAAIKGGVDLYTQIELEKIGAKVSAKLRKRALGGREIEFLAGLDQKVIDRRNRPKRLGHGVVKYNWYIRKIREMCVNQGVELWVSGRFGFIVTENRIVLLIIKTSCMDMVSEDEKKIMKYFKGKYEVLVFKNQKRFIQEIRRIANE